MTIFCAREFSADDIQTIRNLIAQDPLLHRSALSRILCQMWGWVKPNGELKVLVLPWVESKGLASKILSVVARQLPKDWQSRYGFEPVMLETFVEYERHKGTCYKAANWINVGRTAGRGKKSTSAKPLIPLKDIWLYPLRKNALTILCK